MTDCLLLVIYLGYYCFHEIPSTNIKAHSVHTNMALVKMLPFIANPQKASFLSAHLSYSLPKSLTSQRPTNYSPQVYTGKPCPPLRDSLEQWTQLWSNYSLPSSYFNLLASSCQQGAVIESFLFGCLQARSNNVVLLDIGEHMLQ